MRLRVRSETDAFRLVFAIAAAAGLSILLGVAVGAAWGAGLFTLLALVALAWDLYGTDPQRQGQLRAAAEEGRAVRDQRPRLLVIANEALAGASVREELIGHGEPRPKLEVVAPVLLTRVHFTVSDVDRERAEAQQRLDDTLAWAAEHGFDAEGWVGDWADPYAAIGDELRTHGADEVIVATHPPERASWVETGILKHLRSELDLPITHVVIDRPPERVA